MNLPKPKKINAEKYVAGLSLFKQKAAKIKMSANESALGPSPKAIKEFNKVSKNLKRYPDSEGIFLKKVLAKKFKLDPRRIILGSGSDQIFELICKSFLNKNDEVIVPEFSFIIYRIYSKIYGAKIKYAKEKNFKIPHIGRVIINDNVEIASGCTIDRGSVDDTEIGKNTYLNGSGKYKKYIGYECTFAIKYYDEEYNFLVQKCKPPLK